MTNRIDNYYGSGFQLFIACHKAEYRKAEYKGNFIDKKNNGPRFNAEVMELINSARSGQRITFQDIMVKSPKGELRNMGSIAVVIK